MIKNDRDQGVEKGQFGDLSKIPENQVFAEDSSDNVGTANSSQDADVASLPDTFSTSLSLIGDVAPVSKENESWASEACCDKPPYPMQISEPALHLISNETYPTEQEELVNVMQDLSNWKHYDQTALVTMSMSEICSVLRHLHSKIEEVSAELVVLLQERQRLRDEVAIRNIAIEQLLKLQDRLQWRLTEPLAVQMSVVFPPDENEALDCK